MSNRFIDDVNRFTGMEDRLENTNQSDIRLRGLKTDLLKQVKEDLKNTPESSRKYKNLKLKEKQIKEGIYQPSLADYKTLTKQLENEPKSTTIKKAKKLKDLEIYSKSIAGMKVSKDAKSYVIWDSADLGLPGQVSPMRLRTMLNVGGFSEFIIMNTPKIPFGTKYSDQEIFAHIESMIEKISYDVAAGGHYTDSDLHLGGATGYRIIEALKKWR